MRFETLNGFFSKHCFSNWRASKLAQFLSDSLEISAVTSQIDYLGMYIRFIRLMNNYIFYKQFKVDF